jgi:selenocysteine lyase/cysteine desulfurase
LSFRLPVFERALTDLPPTPIADAATDEGFWAAVRRQYVTSPSCTNLENGYWGVMAEPVKVMFHHWIDRINAESSVLIRSRWPELLEGLRQTVAASLGCHADEIVLTRGATEALQAAIAGYNRLRPGDVVLYSDLDYPAMRDAMEWLHQRRGVTPVELAMPEPATPSEVIGAYAQMLERHPRTRLILLSHVSYCTGLVLPVRELSALAESAGAEVILDAAHSWGQLDFEVGQLDVCYAGFNLHKWIGAPLGCGCLYVRRDSVANIDTHLGDREYPCDDIRSRVHGGTPNFAAWMTIPSALGAARRGGIAVRRPIVLMPSSHRHAW